MDALNIAARALWLDRNPGADPAMWDKLSRRTQIWWALKAGPGALELCNLWENH